MRLPDAKTYPRPTFKVPLRNGHVSEYRRTKKRSVDTGQIIYVWEWVRTT